MLVSSLLVVGLALEAFASPLSNVYTGVRSKREVPSSHRLHERHLAHWSQTWAKRSKVADSQILPMRIGLKARNIEAGHDKLMEL